MGIYVISAFPGLGKSYATEKLLKDGYTVSDSDSSQFDKEYFPSNYIEHIKSKIQTYRDMETESPKFIFVSSHKEVRDALISEGIKFVVFYPGVGSKLDLIKRYHDRGSSSKFIELIEDNYDNWIREIEEDEAIENKYPIREGLFLYEVVTDNFITNEGEDGLTDDTVA